MQLALDQFRANIQRVRSIHQLFVSLSGSVTPVLDLSDLLRSEIVLIASALDYFVHEITREGMLEIWRGTRQPTASFHKFAISLNTTQLLMLNAAVDGPLAAEIRAAHGWKTFQRPDNIAEAVRLFSSVDLWNAIGLKMGLQSKAIKTQLELLVDRRNKIAHEADIDPSYPDQRWAIDRFLVEDATDFIEKISESIHSVAC